MALVNLSSDSSRLTRVPVLSLASVVLIRIRAPFRVQMGTRGRLNSSLTGNTRRMMAEIEESEPCLLSDNQHVSNECLLSSGGFVKRCSLCALCAVCVLLTACFGGGVHLS